MSNETLRLILQNLAVICAILLVAAFVLHGCKVPPHMQHHIEYRKTASILEYTLTMSQYRAALSRIETPAGNTGSVTKDLRMELDSVHPAISINDVTIIEDEATRQPKHVLVEVHVDETIISSPSPVAVLNNAILQLIQLSDPAQEGHCHEAAN